MLYGRQTIIEYHILHMQHIFFIRSSPCIILSQFYVVMFTSDTDHRIMQHNSKITYNQLYQQSVIFAHTRKCGLHGKYTCTIILFINIYIQRKIIPGSFIRPRYQFFFKTAFHPVTQIFVLSFFTENIMQR